MNCNVEVRVLQEGPVSKSDSPQPLESRNDRRRAKIVAGLGIITTALAFVSAVYAYFFVSALDSAECFFAACILSWVTSGVVNDIIVEDHPHLN